MQALQLDMFLPIRARARATDPITSHSAADKVDANSQCQRVLDCLRQHGQMTSNQIDDLLGVRRSMAHRRLPELLERGLVECVQQGDRLLTVNGARVWRAT